MVEFRAFQKIARYSREVIVTEKIDGTNAQVFITEDGEMYTGSRTRVITPEDDNFGFAAWAMERKADLVYQLGPGCHYGEWWGHKIQRGYGLPKGDRRFSLFGRELISEKPRIEGLCVVPVLWRGTFDKLSVPDVMEALAYFGSQAAPGFMDPEGIVIYHPAADVMFKKTFKKDEAGKNRGA